MKISSAYEDFVKLEKRLRRIEHEVKVFKKKPFDKGNRASCGRRRVCKRPKAVSRESPPQSDKRDITKH